MRRAPFLRAGFRLAGPSLCERLRRTTPARLFLAVAFALGGCETPLPRPPLAAQAEDVVPVVVPYPPPPAKGDVILDPPQAMKTPVWIDGQWLWRGRGWIWETGRWEDLKAGVTWAPPFVVRRDDGALLWYPGTLRDPSAVGIPPPPAASVESGGPTP